MADLTINIIDNGNIEITADVEAIDHINDCFADGNFDSISVLSDMTEHYWTNGSYRPFDGAQGNPFIGLTDADCIAESIDYDNDGNAFIDGRAWYYPESAIRSPLDELVKTGKVVFKLI